MANGDGTDPAEPVVVDAPGRGPQVRPAARRREDSRTFVAAFLLVILLIEVLFAITATWLPGVLGSRNVCLEELKDIMTIVFAPTAALVGSAAGFYFGRESNGNPRA